MNDTERDARIEAMHEAALAEERERLVRGEIVIGTSKGPHVIKVSK